MLTAGTDDRQEESSPRRRRWPAVLGSVLFVVVGTLVQLPRQSGVEMWQTVWAEDGAEFYEDAVSRPLRETVFDSYAGYAHVVPRALASIGVHLPADKYSEFVSLSGALAATLLCLFVYFSSAPLLRSRIKQAILTLALLLWPVLPFEITGNITNIQWAMPMACLLAILLPVERPGAIAVRVLIVALAPMSSPLCVLFIPIAVWHVARWLTRRTSSARLVVPGVYVLSSAGQLFIWSISPQISVERPSAMSFAGDVTKLYSTKVSTEFLFGVRVTEDLWGRFGYALAVVATAAIGGALLWRFGRATATGRWIIGIFTIASVAIYVSSIWQRAEFLPSMIAVNDGVYAFLGMRYQLFPAALLLLALLVPVDLERGAIADPKPRPPRSLRTDLRDHRVALAVAAIWALVAFVPSYRLDTGRSSGPDWDSGVSVAAQACRVDSVGTQAVAISPAPAWFVMMPCSALTD